MEGKREAKYFSYNDVAYHFSNFMTINCYVMTFVALFLVPFMTNPPHEPESKLRAFLNRKVYGECCKKRVIKRQVEKN